MKNIKDLTCLTVLNLSQNCNLTDKSLELISGICVYFSLFEESIIAYSKTQFAGSKNIIPYSCLGKYAEFFPFFVFLLNFFKFMLGEDFCKDKCDIIWSILTYVHGNGFTESNSQWETHFMHYNLEAFSPSSKFSNLESALPKFGRTCLSMVSSFGCPRIEC